MANRLEEGVETLITDVTRFSTFETSDEEIGRVEDVLLVLLAVANRALTSRCSSDRGGSLNLSSGSFLISTISEDDATAE